MRLRRGKTRRGGANRRCLALWQEAERYARALRQTPPGELEALAQRFQVAQLLASGKNYNEINEMTGVSTATICRVNKCLNYGDGGYRTVLERLCEE